jgi:hypothetical protein
MLLLGTLIFTLLIGVWDEWIYDKYAEDVYQMVQTEITAPATTNISQGLQKELTDWAKNHWGVDGLAISMSPAMTTGNHVPVIFTYTKDQKTARFLDGSIQPQLAGEGVRSLKSANANHFVPVLLSNYSGYRYTDDYDINKHFFTVHVAMKYFNYTLFNTLAYCLLAGYWLMFTLWASMNAYYDRLGKAYWILVFMTLNVAGYLIYLIYRKPRSMQGKMA